MSIGSSLAATPIVALDVPSMSAALALVDELGDACDFYKIGSELFTAEGPRVVEAVRARGNDVFLDLKFHDIPKTVAGGVRRAASLGARLVTVHAVGGEAMLQAAVSAAVDETGERPCDVLAVTVLTSLGAPGLATTWGRTGPLDVSAEVVRLAGVAQRAGVHGVVCSGLEAPVVRQRLGGSLAILVPGVRLPGDDAGDQSRVVTPGAAAAAGARYVVLGRSVTTAADRRDAMERAVRDIAAAAIAVPDAR